MTEAAVATEWVDLLSDCQLLDSDRELEKGIENSAFNGLGVSITKGCVAL